MVEIASDNADIERAIAELCALVVKYGGTVDDKLIFREAGGNLSILAPSDVPKHRKILRAPNEALLFLDLYDVAAEGDDFVLKDVKPEATEAQRVLMEQMLNIYNLCGKIPDFKKYNTMNLFWHDRELLTRVMGTALVDHLENNLLDDFEVKGFFRTRQLGTKLGYEGKTRAALMPVIDFLNHNIGATNFSMKKDGLEIHRYSIEGGTAECFVRYGPYDALDLCNTYGYVDRTPCYVYARPMTVELPGLGKLKIGQQNKKYLNVKLPKHLMDLQPLFPPLHRVKDTDIMAIGFLRIPTPEAPRSLRRIIHAVVGQMCEGNFPSNKDELIDKAEREIVEGTRNYYQSLKDDLANYEAAPEIAPVIENLHGMARIQLSHLSRYNYKIARSPRGQRRPAPL